MNITLLKCIIFQAWTKMTPPKILNDMDASKTKKLKRQRQRDDRRKSKKPFEYHDRFWNLSRLDAEN